MSWLGGLGEGMASAAEGAALGQLLGQLRAEAEDEHAMRFEVEASLRSSRAYARSLEEYVARLERQVVILGGRRPGSR